MFRCVCKKKLLLLCFFACLTICIYGNAYADDSPYYSRSFIGIGDNTVYNSTGITKSSTASMSTSVRAGHSVVLRFSHNVYATSEETPGISYSLTRTVDGQASAFVSVSGEYTVSPVTNSDTKTGSASEFAYADSQTFFVGVPQNYSHGGHMYIERGVYTITFSSNATTGYHTFCETMSIDDASSTSCAQIEVTSVRSEPFIEISSNDAMLLQVIPGHFGSMSKTFSVSTNNYSGYSLTYIANGGSSDLVKTDDENEVIPSIGSSMSQANFITGYYGLSITSSENTNSDVLFSPVPFTSAATVETTTHSKLSDTYTMTIGVKTSPGVVPGLYSRTYTIAAVANPDVYYSVSYNANTTDTVTNMPVNIGLTTVYANAVSITTSSSIPVRAGYDFIGWSKSANETSAECQTDSLCSFNLDPDTGNNLTLYAVWKKRITISYNANGGTYDGDNASGNIDDQIVPASGSIDLADNWYYRNGYFFTGWATSADGDAQYYPGETITPLSDMTLYATWVQGYWEDQSSIPEDPGGGSNENPGGGNGDDPGNNQGEDPGTNQGEDPGTDPGTGGNDPNPGTGTGTGGGNNPDPGTGTGTGGSIDPGVDPGTNTGGGNGGGSGGGGSSSASMTGMKLYDAVATLSRGTLEENSTSLTDTIKKGNSGVYKYSPSIYGTSSDASDGYDIYFYRGILDRSLGVYGSDGDSINWPSYVMLDNNTCWRIVRTTGSGGTKLIYNGTYGATTTGSCANSTTNAQISSTAFSSTDRHYLQSVGYLSIGNLSTSSMNCTPVNIMSNSLRLPYYSGVYWCNDYSINMWSFKSTSTIKTTIDSWFSANMALDYETTYEHSFGFCDDRLPLYTSTIENGEATFSALDNNTVLTGANSWYGESNMTPYYFVSYIRNATNNLKPSYTCNGTYNYSSVGAKGLLTASEASFAGSGLGGNIASYNAHSFLNTGSYFWTISPSLRGSNGIAFNFSLGSDGSLRSASDGNFSVRPVISLRNSEVITGGAGTATSPWLVQRSIATKVATPTIELSDNTLQVTYASDEYGATGCKIYVDGNLQEAECGVTNYLSALNLSAGTYEIKVKATRSGLSDSDFSNSVSYTVVSGYSLTFNIQDYGYKGDGPSDFTSINIKIGSAPTSEYDADVIIEGLFDQSGTSVDGNYYVGEIYDSVSFTATASAESPVIYIWTTHNEGVGGFGWIKINNVTITDFDCSYPDYIDYTDPYTYTLSGDAVVDIMSHGSND